MRTTSPAASVRISASRRRAIAAFKLADVSYEPPEGPKAARDPGPPDAARELDAYVADRWPELGVVADSEAEMHA
jgi:hypothetical protein